MTITLAAVLGPLDWNANVHAFLADRHVVTRIDAVALRQATWAKQIEIADRGNPALPFVRECQTSLFHSVSLLALALYKASAATMRSMFEGALYYTYFRTHPVELGTLTRDEKFYLGREELVDFHSQHTRGFKESQQVMTLVNGMNVWYRKMSRLVHSQVPGSWIEHTASSGIVHDSKVLAEAVQALEDGADLVHRLFLCTVARDLWRDFSSDSKRLLLSGQPGSTKATLGLDLA